MPEDFTNRNSYDHAASNQHFEMIRRGDRYFQRRYQTGLDGKETNVSEVQIDFVLGSGDHARTYLHRTPENTLVQLPLAWYSEKGGYWAMSPGYDSPRHPDAQRTVGYDCMFCHNAYPQTAAASDHFGEVPAFTGALPEGINCERCHGPASQHIAEARRKGATRESVRQAILNPSKLSGDRQMEVCMQCHLQPDSFPPTDHFKRYGQNYFSYDPRLPIGSFMLFFDTKEENAGERFQTSSSAYRLRESACFLKSGGALQCTTCHNPHREQQGEAAKPAYNAACRTCHAQQFDLLVTSQRHTAASSCIDCHMPSRRTQDVVHVVQTDHLIARRPPAGDLLADIAETHDPLNGERAADLYYPPQVPPTAENQLILAIAQLRGRKAAPQSLQAAVKLLNNTPFPWPDPYFETAEATRDAGESTAALGFYREALRRDPAYAPALLRLGTLLAESGKSSEAADTLRGATGIVPGNAAIWNAWGRLSAEQGNTAEAKAAFEKALGIESESAAPMIGLGLLQMQAGDLNGADARLREAIRVQPNSAEAHAALANLLFLTNDPAQAVWEFETAVRIDPADLPTRIGYATLLYTLRRSGAALEQADFAVRLNPGSAEAHHVRGNILEQAGQLKGALEEYRQTLVLAPGAARAELDLGAVLLQTGEKVEAAQHLKVAANAPDPNVRRIAFDLLGSLK